MVQAHASELLNQKEGDDQSPRPIFAATERLAAALDRLERNLQQVAVAQARELQQHEQLVAFERENVQLQQERDNLNHAIGQLKGQYTDLHRVATTIHGKLDDSIKRLTKIVGE